MNVQLPSHMDKAAFLAWAEERGERYELVNGCVVPRKAWVWIRGAAGFPVGPEIIKGDGATIPLPVLGINVTFADVYSRVALD